MLSVAKKKQQKKKNNLICIYQMSAPVTAGPHSLGL